MANQHGGRREGSGRKPVGDRPMVTRAFVIRQDQAAWLEEMREPAIGLTQSELVRYALDHLMESDPDRSRPAARRSSACRLASSARDTAAPA